MKFEETSFDQFRGHDGLKLDIHIWEPDEVKEVIIAIHSELSHAGELAEIATYLMKFDVATVSYDLRGHKQKRLLVDSFEDYLLDTKKFYEWIVEKYPDKPVFVLGNSMGGLIALTLGMKQLKDERISGYIVSSPYIRNRNKLSLFYLKISSLVSKILPNIKIPSEDISQYLTQDQEVYGQIRRELDGGIRGKEISARYGKAILDAQKWFQECFPGNLDKPVIAVIAGEDKIADPYTSIRILQKLDEEQLKLLYYENNYHDNLKEVNREKTFHQIKSWIKSLN